MRSESFFKEWKRCASFIGPIALINPLILTTYVLFWHRGDLLGFWAVGIAITIVLCLFSLVLTFFIVAVDRWRRYREREMERQRNARERLWLKAEQLRNDKAARELAEKRARALMSASALDTSKVWRPGLTAAKSAPAAVAAPADLSAASGGQGHRNLGKPEQQRAPPSRRVGHASQT